MSNDWSDTTLRPIKRQLSVYEKSTILNRYSPALIMPGEPPRIDRHGEIEELLDSLYDPIQIVCVEKDQALAEGLYNHYQDRVQVHWDKVEEFLPRSKINYGYIHLDFCGQMLPDILEGIQAWRNHVAPVARLRVSTQRSRKGDRQLAYEESIRETAIIGLCNACKDLDNYPNRWDEIIDRLQHNNDVTQIVGFVWVLNFLFGIKLPHPNDFVNDKWKLPKPYGEQLIVNLRRFTYNEPGGNTAMETIWCDLIRLERHSIGVDIQWLINELAQLLSLLCEHPPSFNNPDLF